MKKWTACAVILRLAMMAIWAQTEPASYPAGSFSLESGDDKRLDSSDLSGFITVLFYETKDNREVNRPAKDSLNDLFYSLEEADQNKVIRLSVIDCSGASRAFTGVWKKKLLEHSAIEGMDIYGDWDGDMKEAFSFQKDEAYLVILDQQGSVCFFEKGPFNQAEIDEAIRISRELLHS